MSKKKFPADPLGLYTELVDQKEFMANRFRQLERYSFKMAELAKEVQDMITDPDVEDLEMYIPYRDAIVKIQKNRDFMDQLLKYLIYK